MDINDTRALFRSGRLREWQSVEADDFTRRGADARDVYYGETAREEKTRAFVMHWCSPCEAAGSQQRAARDNNSPARIDEENFSPFASLKHSSTRETDAQPAAHPLSQFIFQGSRRAVSL